MQYAITIIRYTDDDEQEILVDQYIEADAAIDFIVQCHGLQTTEEAEPEEEVEEEVVVEEEPKPKKISKGRGAATSGPSRQSGAVDLTALVADFAEGKLNTKEIAAKNGIKYGRAYFHKQKFDRGDYDNLVADPHAETAYARKQREKSEEPEEDQPDPLDEVRNMAREGLSVSELQLMFPQIPLVDIQGVISSL